MKGVSTVIQRATDQVDELSHGHVAKWLVHVHQSVDGRAEAAAHVVTWAQHRNALYCA